MRSDGGSILSPVEAGGRVAGYEGKARWVRGSVPWRMCGCARSSQWSGGSGWRISCRSAGARPVRAQRVGPGEAWRWATAEASGMRPRLGYGLLPLVGLLAAPLLCSRPWRAPPIAPAPSETPAPRAAEPLPRVLTGPMVHAVDGAPIDVPLDGRQVRVRAIGVNTPATP